MWERAKRCPQKKRSSAVTQWPGWESTSRQGESSSRKTNKTIIHMKTLLIAAIAAASLSFTATQASAAPQSPSQPQGGGKSSHVGKSFPHPGKGFPSLGGILPIPIPVPVGNFNYSGHHHHQGGWRVDTRVVDRETYYKKEYDDDGNPYRYRVTTVTYRDEYSDGTSRTYTRTYRD